MWGGGSSGGSLRKTYCTARAPGMPMEIGDFRSHNSMRRERRGAKARSGQQQKSVGNTPCAVSAALDPGRYGA
jgi:hypothetical protein